MKTYIQPQAELVLIPSSENILTVSGGHLYEIDWNDDINVINS